MKSPFMHTVAHLQSRKLIPTQKPTYINVQSLDFSTCSQLPSSSSAPLLLNLPKENLYYGPIADRKAEGDCCIYVFSDGAYYQGQCRKGRFQGKGSLYKYGQDFKQKIFSYEGQWKESRPHGIGREEILNSMTYDGNFVNGKKQGKGVMIYIDGSKYEGEFRNNEVNGKGTYKTSVHEWKGTWKEGYLEGEGIQISYGLPSEDQEKELDRNSVYQGGFQRGLKHGKGTYKWGRNFSEYSGTFLNGQLDGEGRFRLGESQYQGTWKKGVQVSLESTIQFTRVRGNKASKQ